LVFKEVRKAFGGRLEFIISGGASLQPRLVRLFAAMDIPIIEGYGLTETSPVIATNSLALGVIKAGTVGVPCDSVTFKIDPESGEILVKGSAVMKGYYKDEEQTKIAIDEEGYFHTGDIGEFDEDGLLKITGRMKEIFKDSMGKYISPALIENRFMESPFINSIMVVGENQKFAAALIVPNFDHLKTWCEENHIPYTANAEMIKVKAVNDRFRKEVDSYNKFFGDYEKIKRFELLDHEWTIEDGEMTPSLKIRRKAIAERYRSLIDRMFAE
jgi:long-chain acyl-CoA synthetase